jgi:NADPH2:quinone reductase
MRAVVLHGFGGLESLVFKELPDPKPSVGQVLIAVRAFGVNHAETHMRKGEWAEAAEVSGIECVGEVVSAPEGEFRAGDKVAAFMGGLGRTINVSYAELTVAPVTNVIRIETSLPWEEFAVVPESYATAWTCLYGNLQIASGQTLAHRNFRSTRYLCRTSSPRSKQVHTKRSLQAYFLFEGIRDAQGLMESNKAFGKIVVKL